MQEGSPGKRNTEDRIKAARQIRAVRKNERQWINTNKGKFLTNRGKYDYIWELHGLKELFAYLRIKKNTKVLDIGSGTGRAVDEISKSELGKGLEFVKTALINYSGENSRKIHLTSAEVLRGIPSDSFGAILAVFSVAYSEAPELVAQQIDRVLVPGGVFKGSFNSRNSPETAFGKVTLKKYGNLRLILQKMGYDTATISDFSDKYLEFHDSVLLAIKPDPSSGVPRAVDLLEADYSHST
ncbi:MAG: hypothetical protein UW07_C0004G0008 [Candidatus Nomurabacteria bacterium GW2011_GWF2_43_8]|uniref:Methyltransferase type 11 domain-containing protein n=3 Tax=Candidatus Nomuraibacteriota TaxID=1752729 RepID=A0A0G1IP88_9BACT|nr:MAG: hypothetical protein UV76_C0007G0021 [Candidatus Nomurabacteria bacterium GW2011_GWA2_43_15]KKT19119.1 MAG: hypothetical protein UW02_C0015G0023 [Candidatus Nomurabacteria bacterium GW2011_GWB1_43_7]KKT25009.1 MAG: hypothetical protein UW07_C0004G0008 [Candidatus Nomurabacteria bacterium GW2011_GWF2_43_8]